MTRPLIVLFTDFGLEGPYVGQMKAVLHREAPLAAVVDLFHDAPAHDPKPSAYLLAAYAGAFPEGSVLLCVVDPGVGSATRTPIVVRADDRWYVGPDNGLFAIVARRARTPHWWAIEAPPGRLSASFHGRDLFAPEAGRLARGEPPSGERLPGTTGPGDDWPDDLAQIVYIDHFGNAITGLRARSLRPGQNLAVNGVALAPARAFADVPAGEPFWSETSTGRAAIAVKRGRADEALGLAVGAPVSVSEAQET